MTSLRNILSDPEVWNPLVAPDGNHVAWLSTTSGRPAVHVSPTDGGDEQILIREALSGHPSRCYCWALDSENIWLLHVSEDDLAQTALWQVTRSGDVISRTLLGGWSWLYGVTETGVIISDWDRTMSDSGDLYHIEPETGHSTQLTNYGERIGRVAVNPDGRLAYCVPDQFDEDDNLPGGAAVIRERDGTVTVLDDDVQPIDWKGDRLLLTGPTDEHGIGIRAADDRIDWLDSGTPIGFLGTDQVLAFRDGAPVIFPTEQSLCWNQDSATEGTTGNRSAAFTTMGTDTAPSRIVGWDGNDTTTLIAPEYVVPPADLAAPESVTYTDSAGEERDAWLLLPDERPAPCLVHLYGLVPDRGAFDRKFGRPLQYLREQGYASLLPAHGGSRFSERRHTDYRASARWTAKQEWSDGQVVALGHSSGGYDVLMQATHYPDPWNAGIAWNGIADLHRYYDVMAKSRDLIERQLGDDGLDRLAELSPGSNIDTVGFPLLVIQGEQDWMTDQVRDFIHDAKTEEASIEYEEITGLKHWTRDLDLKVQIWRRIEEFLKQTL